MDGRTLIEGVAALKTALELVKAVLPFIGPRAKAGPNGCPGPDFIPIRRTYPGPHAGQPTETDASLGESDDNL
jgi:hypothetical protein